LFAPIAINLCEKIMPEQIVLIQQRKIVCTSSHLENMEVVATQLNVIVNGMLTEGANAIEISWNERSKNFRVDGRRNKSSGERWNDYQSP
jgi:hypothetical protein